MKQLLTLLIRPCYFGLVIQIVQKDIEVSSFLNDFVLNIVEVQSLFLEGNDAKCKLWFLLVYLHGQ